MENEVLSQKLSQLSTTDEQSTTNKRKRSDTSTSLTTHSLIEEEEDRHGNDDIPEYLCITNKSFEQIIRQITNDTAYSMNIEELRQVAILMHQCTMIDLETSLWSTYLKAGTGTLKIEQPGPEIWPTMLKSKIMALNNGETDNDIDDTCLKFVNKRLRQLDHDQHRYQAEINEKKINMDGYMTTIEPVIQTFIQENLRSLHIQYEYTIALIEYDYEDQRLELEFAQLEPNDHQVR
jgi:hypothetical protein